MTEGEVTQKLAAVLAADVEDYSRLMGDDEPATIATLDECREIFGRHIETNSGRVVDTAGDSVMAVFDTSTGAVRAAVDAQIELRRHNESLAEGRRMLFRVGINLGDIHVKDDGTIYGDGVNVAARLGEKSICKAGDVMISEATFLPIRGNPNLAFVDAGEHQVKNIVDSVHVFKVANVPDAPPTGFLFDYEKDVINAYVEGGGQFSDKLVKQGCPKKWPDVPRFQAGFRNPVPYTKTGKHRSLNAKINVDARTPDLDIQSARSAGEGDALDMTFPEAGPRELLWISEKPNPLHIGILVSGGIAPGINAVIQGIVARHRLYESGYKSEIGHDYEVKIFSFDEGFKSLIRPGGRIREISREETRDHSTTGGSIIPTARADELLSSNSSVDTRDHLLLTAATTLYQKKIKILYIIGGEGSMRAAVDISRSYKENFRDELSIVGIPKTMDNDILWVWQSFGFVSAVERAREAILQLHTEISANPRLCIIQLFGSDSGFVVSHAALGSGVCDLALIPELKFTMDEAFACIKSKLTRRAMTKSPFGLVVMAETAIPRDATAYLDGEENKYIGLSESEIHAIREYIKLGFRIRGQTPDELRSGGLKLVSRVLEKKIRELGSSQNTYWKDFRVFVNEPRHLVRSMAPSATDVAYGQRLGTLAVDNALAGYHDFMVSQWLTEYVLVPLPLVILGRKRLPLNGIFWRSVEATTGQSEFLVEDPSLS